MGVWSNLPLTQSGSHSCWLWRVPEVYLWLICRVSRGHETCPCTPRGKRWEIRRGSFRFKVRIRQDAQKRYTSSWTKQLTIDIIGRSELNPTASCTRALVPALGRASRPLGLRMSVGRTLHRLSCHHDAFLSSPCPLLLNFRRYENPPGPSGHAMTLPPTTCPSLTNCQTFLPAGLPVDPSSPRKSPPILFHHQMRPPNTYSGLRRPAHGMPVRL